MTIERPWLVLAGLVFSGVTVYYLGPMLTPFAVAALLAYMGDPVADALERRRLPRSVAVTLVFLGIFILGTVAALLLLPALEHQVRALITMVPKVLDWVHSTLLPAVSERLGLDPQTLNIEQARTILRTHWQSAGGVFITLIDQASRSGLAALGWIADLVLIPVVTFYLLRDWDVLVARVHALVPRRIEPTLVRLTRESDAVLAEFLRGQLLVMASLAAVYTGGLWLVGLKLAFLIGLVAGLVSFVPYLGFVLGFGFAIVAALFQFDGLMPLLYVAAVFGAGQLLESFLLTPLLVGDKIGLHPVAVIFAVLAGGQLFGFFGVLLALPVAAVVVVILRHLHEEYLSSDVYGGVPATASADASPVRAVENVGADEIGDPATTEPE